MKAQILSRTSTLRCALAAVKECAQFEAGSCHPEDAAAIRQEASQLRRSIRFYFSAKSRRRRGRQMSRINAIVRIGVEEGYMTPEEAMKIALCVQIASVAVLNPPHGIHQKGAQTDWRLNGFDERDMRELVD